MDIYNINDIRNEFKNITFSQFQKSKVKNELCNNIFNCKIENSCYWCAEFICAGHYIELWDIIINYYCKYIHYGNPKFLIYLEMRFNDFINIMKNGGYEENILILRNNNKIRKIFAEIICILCYSQKKFTLKELKLDKNNEYNIENISEKFLAPNVSYITKLFEDEEIKQLSIPLNELIYNITVKNIFEVNYWFEWILNYELICNKKKIKCICEARNYAPKGFYNDIIWLIWDIIFFYSKEENLLVDKKNANIINKLIKSSFNIFNIKYNLTTKRKRKHLIILCFRFIIEDINYNICITNKNEEINNIVSKIDLIYKEIKKNEKSPKTDYLFKDLKKTNIEKTIEKIEILNNI